MVRLVQEAEFNWFQKSSSVGSKTFYWFNWFRKPGSIGSKKFDWFGGFIGLSSRKVKNRHRVVGFVWLIGFDDLIQLAHTS